ncbi:MAG: superoxide dismutase [Weeksellaceae bacterium]|nr:superoxide dismutase [Weeksellaceae bacterium]
MKKHIYIVAILGTALFFQSCENTKNGGTTETPTAGDSIVEVDSIKVEENVGSPTDVKADPGIYQIKTLKYGYDELSDYIDAKTMETHYGKHYLGYINNLNTALKDADISESNIVKLLNNESAMKNNAIRNNAGGYYNHLLYFDIMSPTPTQLDEKGALLTKINENFGSVNELKAKLKEAATKRFGSGWAWLIVKEDGSLAVTSTPNQDNPLMAIAEEKGTPILGIDVWEHAYYLKYKNLRADYVDAFFNVLDWKEVENNYSKVAK